MDNNLQKITKLIEQSLLDLRNFLTEQFRSKSEHQRKAAGLLAYWIIDYIRLRRKENTTRYRRFSRGDVVKLHFGFRIGHEEGELHYAIVLNRSDSISNPILTVLPLTSIKHNGKLIRNTQISLGREIFDTAQAKLEKMITNSAENHKHDEAILQTAHKQIKQLDKMKTGSIALVDQITSISKLRIYEPTSKTDLLHRLSVSNATLDAIDKKIAAMFTNLD